MKKYLILISCLAFVLSSCEKKDTQAPLVKILGPNPMTVALNAPVFVDPGATAKDNVDGDLTAQIQVSSNVDLQKKGGYSVRYHVTDQAGNTGEAFRGVIVANEVEFLAAKWTVNDNKVGPGGTPTMSQYIETIKTSDTLNNRFFVESFGNHVDAKVFINRTGNLLAIPQQEMNCGDPPVFRRFMGSGTILDSSNIVINYTETIGSTVYSGSGTYIKR